MKTRHAGFGWRVFSYVYIFLSLWEKDGKEKGGEQNGVGLW